MLLGSSVLMDGNIPVPSASAEEDMSDLSDIRSLEDQPTNVDLRPKLKWFSVAQTACLKSYYGNGMVGTGKNFFSLILKVASDTQLTTDQVKVY